MVIMPTHAQLARAAVAPDVSAPSDPSEFMRKYIIVRDAFSQSRRHERIVIFDSRLRHKDMVPIGCDVLSAGFIGLMDGTLLLPDMPSTSLNCGPRPQDRQLITAFLGHNSHNSH
jgi:hypothetical protein